MYYVFLLRVIKLLACLHVCLLWLTHSSSTCRVALKSLYTYTISPQVGESWIWNPRKLCLRNPESSGALESEIQLKESGTPLTIEIQNTTSTDKDWNPLPRIRNPRAWNPESKTLLNSLTRGKTDLHPPLFWAPFTIIDETMPTSPNDSSASPPIIANLYCPFRAALAPSSRHVHSIVIASRRSSVTHCMHFSRMFLRVYTLSEILPGLLEYTTASIT